AGARPWDPELKVRPGGRAGEIMVIPFNNYLHERPEEITAEVARLHVAVCPWATTTSPVVGAGFYACTCEWRPLPFVFAEVPPEWFTVYRVTADQPPPKPAE